MSEQPPRRVRVTSPRADTTRSRPPVRHAGPRDIEESTGVGEVYMRSLVGTQLRLGIAVCAVLALTLGALPLLFASVPGLADVDVLGLPLFWVLLGGLVYPSLVGLGWWYVRSAERTEREFADLVGGR